ncbi:hypothetical protein [Massilia sp. CCM 8734]|uniref:hypothetical protein n=1 Tax=Massilia sp. CCM 8734 TaxID=2609283 RepID=UPI00141F2E25|nr:hypothetical protein [Massilia sp. CCM 8734]NHZ99686.1 hypothetical protein [Massilia sp. CCM 8734]
MNERIEKSCHEFWLMTCGLNTHARGKGYAQLDTPWNAFGSDDILVCTLWTDEIVSVFDPLEAKVRKFVKIGGKMKLWKGPARTHGAQADQNLRRAAKDRLRVVGYEAEPYFHTEEPDARSVKHFYLDRAHELKRIFDFSEAAMLERLRVEEAFGRMRQEEPLQPAYLYELVSPRGDFPGMTAAQRKVGIPDEIPDQNDSNGEDEDADDDLVLFAQDEHEKASTEMYAKRCLPILIAHVLEQNDQLMETLTYKELAASLGRLNKNGEPWARGLGHVLSRVTSMIEGVDLNWSQPTPYLTTIVVAGQGPNKGLPGVGVKERWTGYEQLILAEKRSKLANEHEKIIRFGDRWNEVLERLGLDPVPAVDSENKKNSGGGWGGGESEQHKALKLFVKNHPELVGADASWFSSNEYVLRSGDEIDVFFKSEDWWIGVEVKSAVSDGLERDYERGLYQVVKYQAVLEAQALIDCPDKPPQVRVFLVLESLLPKKYVEVAKRLKVDVKANIKPLT